MRRRTRRPACSLRRRRPRRAAGEADRQVGALADDAHLLGRRRSARRSGACAHPPRPSRAGRRRRGRPRAGASVSPASCASACVGNWQLTHGISAPSCGGRRPLGLLGAREPLGRDVGAAARVLGRVERDAGVHVLAREAVDLGQLAEQLLGRLRDPERGRAATCRSRGAGSGRHRGGRSSRAARRARASRTASSGSAPASPAGRRGTARRGASRTPRRADRRRSKQPPPVLLDDLAVELDPAAGPEVLDHVPVDGAHVRAAECGKPVPIARWIVPSIFSSKSVFFMCALDARVAADAELAEPARALVGVERAEQELLVARLRMPRRCARPRSGSARR